MTNIIQFPNRIEQVTAKKYGPRWREEFCIEVVYTMANLLITNKEYSNELAKILGLNEEGMNLVTEHIKDAMKWFGEEDE